jgi:hypothetical protein
MSKTVPPELGAESFSCPHCGALAHQTWYRLYTKRLGNAEKPSVPTLEMVSRMKSEVRVPNDSQRNLIDFFERASAKEIFLDGQHALYNEPQVINVSLSRCYSCGRMLVWHADNLIYPTQQCAAVPNEDMPADVRSDFLEASAIVESSPRGAAALLRLAIQKLMPHLGEKGQNINEDIGALVKKGLNEKAQKALDAVRVIGNNAVHPGTIDLNDDKATAVKLFGLVNFIVQTQISDPKKIDEIYDTLPSGAVAAIEKRDGIAQIPVSLATSKGS